MVSAVFTGLYRHNSQITNLSLNQRIDMLRRNGVDNIFWYVWEGHSLKEVEDRGVKIVQIKEPYPHVRGIPGRQRQIYNIKRALGDFDDEEVILKLRWDIDFNNTLVKNVVDPNFFDPIENGIIENKIWTGFYSIQELFSPADTSFAGYKKDLDKLINFEHSIDGISANNYISHDGMMLMPQFIERNKEVCNLIKVEPPFPNGLMFTEEHYTDEEYLKAWAYSYYVIDKYFKTGPLGTCFFKRGDVARWPASIVDYDNFIYNYDTITGRRPKLGLYPRYRVYDDVFVKRLVSGQYQDYLGQTLADLIRKNKDFWSSLGI